MSATRVPHPVRLRALEQGKTLVDLARETGYSSASMKTALRGPSWPEFRRRVSLALGIPEAELFESEK